jgi:ABC-type transport system involved in multi-copper enzyme maturation permease subunit
MSARRVWLVARHTLSETLRLRLAGLFAVMGVALVLMALRLREFNFGAAELKFIADIGLGGIGLLGTLLAALATAQVFFDDLENGFAACVLAKSVRRWEYVGGRLVGVIVLLLLFVAGLAVLLAVLVRMRESQLGAAFVPLPVFLQACALVWLKTTLVAAMTLMVCSYSGSALFASCAGLLLAAIAHLRAFADHRSGPGWLRIWPDLGAFDVDPLLSTGRGLGWHGLLSLGAYWTLFMVLFTALAVYVFKHREF